MIARRACLFALCAGLAPIAPAGGAVPATVLIVTGVAANALPAMAPDEWKRLVVRYVAPRTPIVEDGIELPDEARCRSAGAAYAVLATFERTSRPPGADPDRIYGVGRFTVRNCVTGAVAPVKVVQLRSDPLPEAARGDFEPPPRTWDRAAVTTLAVEPLVVITVARVVRVDGDVVVIESSNPYDVNQVLRIYADSNAKPYAEPVRLVVLERIGKYLQAAIIGAGKARAGDYVDAGSQPSGLRSSPALHP